MAISKPPLLMGSWPVVPLLMQSKNKYAAFPLLVLSVVSGAGRF